MTSDAASPRFEFDDDDRQFMADVGLPAADSVPWRACPPLTLLLAADEGALPGDAQDHIASHLAACAFCRSLVQDVKEAGLGGPTAEEHDRIQARVRVAAAAATARPQAIVTRRRFMVPGALALAASFVLVAGLAWYARSLQRKTAGLEEALAPLRATAEQGQQRVAALEGQLAALQAQVDRPLGEANVPVVDLEPVGARRDAAETARKFGIPDGARFVTVILQLDAGNADALSAEIRDASGGLRWSMDGLHASPLGVVTVLVPRTGVPEGNAVITLVRVRDGRRVTLAEYRARFGRM